MNINLIIAVFTACMAGALVSTSPLLASLATVCCALNAMVVQKMLVDKRG